MIQQNFLHSMSVINENKYFTPKVYQLTLPEAKAIYNCSYSQLLNACKSKLLKHNYVGKKIVTTNIAMEKYLSNLMETVDIMPERENFDVSVFRKQRESFSVKDALNKSNQN